MNELVLIEFNSERIVYQYTPEGKGAPGRIAICLSTGEAVIEERAQNDEFGRYGHNAMRRVNEYVAKKNLPMNAIQAWN